MHVHRPTHLRPHRHKHSPVVRWEPRDDTPRVMTPRPDGHAHRHARQAVVVGLALACTCCALYDVYLMAAGF